MSGGKWIAVALVLVVSGAGCVPSKFKTTYPVRGQVLLNGKPVGGVKVILISLEDKDDLVRPAGSADDEGRFVLSTYANEDGAPAGSYVVTVVTPLPEPKGQAGQKKQPQTPPGPPSKVPARYGNPETSGLTVTVEPRENELPPLNLAR